MAKKRIRLQVTTTIEESSEEDQDQTPRVSLTVKLRESAAKKKAAKMSSETAEEKEYGYAMTRWSVAMFMRNTHFGWSPWMAHVRHPDHPRLRVPGPEYGIRHEIEDKDKPKLEPVVVRLKHNVV